MTDFLNNRRSYATARAGAYASADAGQAGGRSAARPRGASRGGQGAYRFARTERRDGGEDARRHQDRRATRGSTHAGSGRSGASTRQNSFMRYATDNRVVRAIYALTTGPYKVLVIAVVVIAAALSIYFPVRDYYVAYRTSDILARQLELREEYNKRLEADVDQLLSTEGIEAAARENLGLVKPGEKRIDVVGGDEVGDDAESVDGASEDGGTQGGSSSDGTDGSADAEDGDADAADGSSGQDAADGSSETDGAGDAAAQGATTHAPTNAQELEDAERAVALDAPWYINVLDAVFFYSGVDGQTVASTGE